ncbi:MAG: dihydroneopterin aldolase [Spirochaetales bacterium]|nr:dihydroneopterin aldolase [Spirochaetales bacterium]
MASDRDMRDVVFIRDLLVRCIVGIRPEEREKPQDVVINIDLYTDTSRAAASDDISDALDYSTLKKKVIALAEASSYNLVETLAERIAGLCLGDGGVSAVSVSVEKPTALRFARTVGVRIYRERK